MLCIVAALAENPLLHPDRARNETTEERSARKKLVKEQKSEKRKNKVQSCNIIAVVECFFFFTSPYIRVNI